MWGMWVFVCVHKKTESERLYTALITMLSCHHFLANVWDGKAETPEGQSWCCWWNTVLHCRGTYVPEAMKIPRSCEVQSNLHTLGISIKNVLTVPGENFFFRTSERRWPMLTTTGEGYQRTTVFPSHLLLQLKMAILSYNSNSDSFRYFDSVY